MQTFEVSTNKISFSFSRDLFHPGVNNISLICDECHNSKFGIFELLV